MPARFRSVSQYNIMCPQFGESLVVAGGAGRTAIVTELIRAKAEINYTARVRFRRDKTGCKFPLCLSVCRCVSVEWSDAVDRGCAPRAYRNRHPIDQSRGRPQ